MPGQIHHPRLAVGNPRRISNRAGSPNDRNNAAARRKPARTARGQYTYGLKRTEILSAQANGLTLLLLSMWLTYEASRRLIAPPEVAGGLVVITAVVGIVVNLAAAWAISHATAPA